MHPAHKLGQDGEAIAEAYLRKHNFLILHRNMRFGRDEVDFIAFDGVEMMVTFVEVKTRTHHSNAFPIRTAIDARKKRCIRRCIDQWTAAVDYDRAVRIDALCVHNGIVIEHLKDIDSTFD